MSTRRLWYIHMPVGIIWNREIDGAEQKRGIAGIVLEKSQVNGILTRRCVSRLSVAVTKYLI